MTDPKTIALEDPIVADGLTVSEITVRPPRVKDIQAMNARKGADDLDKSLFGLSLVTGQAPKALAELTLKDFDAVEEAALGFYPERLRSLLTSVR